MAYVEGGRISGDSVVKKTSRPLTHVLSALEKETLSWACDAPCFSDAENLTQITAEADHISCGLKLGMRDLHSKTKLLGNANASPGLLILSNLPIVENPFRLVAIIASLAGNIVSYPGEGEHIIAIKAQQTIPGERPNFKNAHPFYLHTDLSYTDKPPKLMGLYSRHNDAEEGGFSVFADVREAVKHLSESDIEELQKPQFLFPAPSHFEGPPAVIHSILSRGPKSGEWNVRFRRDNLGVLTRPGIEAVIRFIAALKQVSFEMSLDPHTIALADNRSFLHGRTAFAEGYKGGEPRCLYRVYAELR